MAGLNTIYITENEEHILSLVYEGVDLSTFDSFTLVIRTPDGGCVVKNGVLGSPTTNGTFTISPGDLEAGTHRAELRFITGGVNVRIEPGNSDDVLIIEVRDTV